MGIISLRINDEDLKLIQAYASANNLNISSFIREAALDKIEDDLKLDEKRIIQARKQSQSERQFTFEEAWAEVGV